MNELRRLNVVTFSHILNSPMLVRLYFHHHINAAVHIKREVT